MATKKGQEDVDLVTEQLSHLTHLSADGTPHQSQQATPEQREISEKKKYVSRKKDTDYTEHMSLKDKSFGEAKETLINLVNKILEKELQSYFYIGKAYIEERVKKQFDIENSDTWHNTGICNAFKGSHQTKMKCSEDFNKQKMFILAAIDKTVIRSADIKTHCEGPDSEVMTVARFVEYYTTSLEAALITYYHLGAGNRPKEIANTSIAAGNSAENSSGFVLYMRVAKPNDHEQKNLELELSED